MDRLEKIEINSYLEFEKFEIAKSYLIPEILKQHNMAKSRIRIPDSIIKYLAEFYTREAGVRQLKNVLNTIIRKATRHLIENPDKKSISINKELISDFIGKEKIKKQEYKTTPNVGVAIGLAWTASGGDILPIEVTLMPGKEKIHLTGKLGDVMKESAHIALSYIRANATVFNIDPEFYNKNEIHIHVPEGAIPKDGPSAGITLTVAILSSLLNKKPNKIAMTGEITLRGHVLAIGGLKEKLMSAIRYGIDSVIIPYDNQQDLDEIDESIKSKLTIHLVQDFSQIPQIIGFK
jgi:ATP-dependent Lon protease